MPQSKNQVVSAKKVQSFVKKEIADLQADAKRLESFLSSLQSGPERFSIKICDCCIKIE